MLMHRRKVDVVSSDRFEGVVAENQRLETDAVSTEKKAAHEFRGADS